MRMMRQRGSYYTAPLTPLERAGAHRHPAAGHGYCRHKGMRLPSRSNQTRTCVIHHQTTTTPSSVRAPRPTGAAPGAARPVVAPSCPHPSVMLKERLIKGSASSLAASYCPGPGVLECGMNLCARGPKRPCLPKSPEAAVGLRPFGAFGE